MTAADLVLALDEIGVLGYRPAEVVFIYETMDEFQPDFLCEWGTNVGHSARMFHETKLALNLSCEIHSVDSVDLVPILRLQDKGRSRGSMVENCPVELHVGDGAKTAVAIYPKSHCTRPLFFIDTNHTEEETYFHLTLLSNKTPEAVMLLHDASLSRDGEPERALRRFLVKHQNYEVDEAPDVHSMVRLWPCH